MSVSVQENAGLCWKCQAILNAQYSESLDVLETEYDRTLRTSDPLQATASAGCPLCSHLLHSFSDADRAGLQQLIRAAEDGTLEFDVDYEHSVANAYDPEGGLSIMVWLDTKRASPKNEIGDIYYTTMNLFPETGKPSWINLFKVRFLTVGSETLRFANHGEVHCSTNSETSRAIVAEWLDQCVNAHPTCNSLLNKVASRPSRVLDCSTGTPRLLVVRDDTPPFQYATMSHCWGGHVPLRLLSDNIDDLQVELPVAQLSQSFRDAIQVLHWLGLSYLWIDSLCIVQDSLQDWEKESALMAEVYSNSHCNIAAAHAADGTQGCFTERDPRLVKPLKVDLSWGLNPGVYYGVHAEVWQHNVMETPLNSRAWVCQERYLAPRNLFFGKTQLFWECYDCSACETFPVGLPPGVTRMVKFSDPHTSGAAVRHQRRLSEAPELNALSLWGEIVEQYSKGQLTFPGDKLVALSRLASRMQKHVQSDYLSGLWRTHLPAQLLWEIKMDAPGERLEFYTAPSWSWASVHGVIEQACVIDHTDDFVLKVQEAQTQNVGEANPFGQVKAGYIRARGYLAKAGVHVEHASYYLVSYRIFIHDKEVGDAVIENYKREDPSAQPAENTMRYHGLYYVPIRIRGSTSYIEGLVLREKSPGSGEFVRCGIFWVRQEAVPSFQAVCRGHSTGSRQDGTTEDTREWGPKLEFTII